MKIGKMKISILTILLIIATLHIGIMTYGNYMLNSSQREVCEALGPDWDKVKSLLEQGINTSPNEEWGECLNRWGITSAKYGYSLVGSYILFFLTLLSLKVDQIYRNI